VGARCCASGVGRFMEEVFCDMTKSLKRNSWLLYVILAMILFAFASGGGGCSPDPDPDPSPEVPGNSMKITPARVEIAVGETVELTVQNYEGELDWRTSNTEVADIFELGRNGKATVKGYSEGRATISVFDENGKSASCEVTVTLTEALPDPVTIDENNVYMENVTYSQRIFQITIVISASFARESDRHQAIPPREIVLSHGDYREGDVLVARPSRDWRNGFAGVVESVEQLSDGNTSYTLGQAGFGDVLESGSLSYASFATPSELVGDNEDPEVPTVEPTWARLMEAWKENRLPYSLIGPEKEGVYIIDIRTKPTDLPADQKFDLRPWKDEVKREWSAGGASFEFDFGLRWTFASAGVFSKNAPGDIQAVGAVVVTQATQDFSVSAAGGINKEVTFAPEFSCQINQVIWMPGGALGFPIPIVLSEAIKISPYANAALNLNLEVEKEVTWREGMGILWEKGRGLRELNSGRQTLSDTSVPADDIGRVQVNGNLVMGVKAEVATELYWLKILTHKPSFGVELTGTLTYDSDTGAVSGNGKGDFVLQAVLHADLLELLATLMPDSDNGGASFERTLDPKRWNIFKLPNRVTGVVTDATVRDQARKIPGARIVFRDTDEEDGEEKASVTTDSNGRYELVNTLSLGLYYVEITAEGYFPYRNWVSIEEGNALRCDFEMSPDDGGSRVILRWGATPRDLDSHLTGPRANNSRFHVYYSQKTDTGNAQLDVDDVDGYGPETVTILSFNPGVYRYSVYDFTNGGSNNSSALMNSGVTVRLDLAGVGSFTFDYPQGNGTLWTVFEIHVEADGRKRVVPINRMSYQSGSAGITSIKVPK